MRILGLFPGQGSQTVGMGEALQKHSDVAAEMFRKADESLGFSLSKLCFSGPLSDLTLTENAQPAILVVSSICYAVSGIKLSAAAGHSLGEYSALVAAGVISFEDAVQLVHKRGRYMQEAVPAGEGQMVAVMGPSEDEIRTALETIQSGVAQIANLNSPGQTVVAGDKIGIAEFSAEITKSGAKLIPLNVSAPFHCSLMKPAADKLSADLDAITFHPPQIPVYANADARLVRDASDARELLKKQVCSSVRWTECMQHSIAEQQIDTSVEFGSGGVLTKLLKRIHPATSRYEVSDPESLAKTRAALLQKPS